MSLKIIMGNMFSGHFIPKWYVNKYLSPTLSTCSFKTTPPFISENPATCIPFICESIANVLGHIAQLPSTGYLPK